MNIIINYIFHLPFYLFIRNVILILSDILLKPIKIKDKHERKAIMERLYKVHSIFLRILERFGPEPLAMMIPIFGTQQTGRHRRRGASYSFDDVLDSQEQKENINEDQIDKDENYDTDDDNVQHGSGLSVYDSFWDLTSNCFSMTCHKITLEEMVNKIKIVYICIWSLFFLVIKS